MSELTSNIILGIAIMGIIVPFLMMIFDSIREARNFNRARKIRITTKSGVTIVLDSDKPDPKELIKFMDLINGEL